MSIIGIDKDKCTNCKQCIQECGRGYFYLGEEGQVLFNDTLGCNICGHCIAICPEEAILTKGLEDVESVNSGETWDDLENPGDPNWEGIDLCFITYYQEPPESISLNYYHPFLFRLIQRFPILEFLL